MQHVPSFLHVHPSQHVGWLVFLLAHFQDLGQASEILPRYYPCNIWKQIIVQSHPNTTHRFIVNAHPRLLKKTIFVLFSNPLLPLTKCVRTLIVNQIPVCYQSAAFLLALSRLISTPQIYSFASGPLTPSWSLGTKDCPPPWIILRKYDTLCLTLDWSLFSLSYVILC